MKKSILAGLCVGLACRVWMKTENPYVGALLFGFALYCVCLFGLRLLTGQLGRIHDVKTLAYTGAGNLAGALLAALLVLAADSSAALQAKTIMENKANAGLFALLFRGVGCGMLMYLAVQAWRAKNSPASVAWPIAIFILSGFEHSIADMVYGFLSLDAILFLKVVPIVLVGNIVGSEIMGYLFREKPQPQAAKEDV